MFTDTFYQVCSVFQQRHNRVTLNEVHHTVAIDIEVKKRYNSEASLRENGAYIESLL